MGKMRYGRFDAEANRPGQVNVLNNPKNRRFSGAFCTPHPDYERVWKRWGLPRGMEKKRAALVGA